VLKKDINIKMSSSDQSLKIFAKILSFVNELKQVFPRENIQLYHKLLKKTPIGNTEAISKHLHVFDQFISSNQEAIKTKNVEKLEGDIFFSKKVYLNIISCMKESDNETRQVIFKHLQVLLFLLHPNEEIKEIVQPIAQKSSGGEDKFLENFMNKIEQTFTGQEFNDPMQATMSLLNSGVFSDMIQTMNKGMSSGEIDISKLLGSVQGMLGNLGGNSSDPQLSQMMNMATQMMSNINLNPGTGQDPQ
jgi:hypothetical protein